ncbi:hypothetical protein NLC26_01610 [Candidatus Aminicenantes bacterium AC-708-M15]|jgi:hypothetical protein|nr:hypothetical protein [SCandidatus Aminicenantes bacterium Aminicenantia_JdfR_composite]MCP2598802.1 hypothetical protein [Candidatus Aminicenantes bacterium AC-335-L06]MCP2604158.1 hypothetical protein [Candidatus Aminicenantes bacterium AC-708-M15]MCP2617935.1 hypothetical protein [Candidatus Aminicenantes bacterium AC-335-A11]
MTKSIKIGLWSGILILIIMITAIQAWDWWCSPIKCGGGCYCESNLGKVVEFDDCCGCCKYEFWWGEDWLCCCYDVCPPSQ